MSQFNVSESIRSHICLPPMLCIMAILAEQLQVVPIERDARIVDVVRCQPDLVMHLKRTLPGSCIDDPFG